MVGASSIASLRLERAIVGVVTERLLGRDRLGHRPEFVVDDPLVRLTGADRDAARGRQTSALDDLDGPFDRIGHRVRRTPPPPSDGFLTGVTVVLEADPFGFVLVPADAVIDAERLGRVLVGPALGVYAVVHVLDLVLGRRDLLGNTLAMPNNAVTCRLAWPLAFVRLPIHFLQSPLKS